jgi:hypothetical protein
VSEWRRLALTEFPEFRSDIERAETAHGVFFALLPALHDAYRDVPLDESMIRRVYAFADWSSAPDRHPDVRGAAMASFYEHLPEFGPAWRDLPGRVSPERLMQIRKHLRSYLSVSDYGRAMATLDQASVRSGMHRPPSNEDVGTDSRLE